jgi:hypothetical protein
MATENYDSKETKEFLLRFTGDMVEAWEDFLTNKDAVSALLEELWQNI